MYIYIVRYIVKKVCFNTLFKHMGLKVSSDTFLKKGKTKIVYQTSLLGKEIIYNPKIKRNLYFSCDVKRLEI